MTGTVSRLFSDTYVCTESYGMANMQSFSAGMNIRSVAGGDTLETQEFPRPEALA
jgi:hypothetical protein